MLIIPAVDILGGRCVRLRRGEPSTATVYDDDPAAVAVRWERAGARWLHVVDLDGARTGVPQNLLAVQRIVRSVSIPIQCGGGIREKAHLEEVLRSGVDRVILSTAALSDLDFLAEACGRFGDQVAVALDVKDERAVVEGWTTATSLSLLEAAGVLVAAGVKRLVYTDVSRDGMLSGPNFDGLKALLDAVKIPIIASGGISSVSDLERLVGLAPYGLEGVIIGRALYEGKIDLSQVIARFGVGEDPVVR